MPLFHIEGTVRNLFNPILSGGSVISCNGVNPIYSIIQQMMLMSSIPKMMSVWMIALHINYKRYDVNRILHTSS